MIFFTSTKLLTDPAIMFCDEPTTGLDSFSALSVIKSLKSLTSQSMNRCEGVGIESDDRLWFPSRLSKTIICSIHQPTSEVYHCFTHIILMARGRIIFQGTANDCLHHFSRQVQYIAMQRILPIL